jgi:RNA-directed DNA polymerase
MKYEWNNWREIDWKVVETAVFKLQKRIYKASQRGDTKAVHRLQKLLTKSYFGKLWAIKRVTQDNQGKNTAGIDEIKSLTPAKRLEMVGHLNVEGKSKPIRKVWIPKTNREKRPLGIPCMKDRVLQCLIKLALEPEWEAKFEPNSYGFRPGRSCHDAITAIFNAIRYEPKYVLDADIAKCFDKINHQKLLNKLGSYPSIEKQIKAWLKSGVMDGKWFPTEEATPQGGMISPLLANIALHGMEIEIKSLARNLEMTTSTDKVITDKKVREGKLHLIRYADNFVILHKNINVIHACKETIEAFLLDMGLELKPSKTKISHTLNKYQGNIGFDFLGFNVRQYKTGINQSGRNPSGERQGHKTLIKPSKDKIKAHVKKIGDIIRLHRTVTQEVLIEKLNPIIRGWSNYYRTVCSAEIFNYCDNILYHQLRKWTHRRHPKKNGYWVSDKYWKRVGNRKWTFATNKTKILYHSEIKIQRHVKVKGTNSIYDGNLTYWPTRMGKHPGVSTKKAKLLKI